MQPFHIWQITANGPWTGRNLFDGALVSTPSVPSNIDGSLEIFGIGTDGNLYTNFQTSPGGRAQMSFAPSVAMNPDGSLQTFGVGPNGEVWNWVKNRPGPNSSWSGLESAATSSA